MNTIEIDRKELKANLLRLGDLAKEAVRDELYLRAELIVDGMAMSIVALDATVGEKAAMFKVEAGGAHLRTRGAYTTQTYVPTSVEVIE